MSGFDVPVHDTEGQNRILPVLLGWRQQFRRTINVLSIKSKEPPLDLDNPLVLAALGVIASHQALTRWVDFQVAIADEVPKKPADDNQQRLLR